MLDIKFQASDQSGSEEEDFLIFLCVFLWLKPRPAIKITGGLQLVCGRPTLALSSALVPQTHSCLVCVEDFLINALS